MNINTAPSSQVEGLLESWNLRYRLVDDFPLDQIRVEQETQVRDAGNQADPQRAEEYTYQFESGTAKFPPIVLRDSTFALIDGNTRVAMARKLKLTEYPAYLVELASADLAMVIGASLNQMGGKRLDPNEANQAALIMMSSGMRFSDAQIAASVGRAAAQVRQWRTEVEACNRAEALHVEAQMAQVPTVQRRIIAKVKHDEPFRAITKLVADSKVLRAELSQLVNNVEAAGSDEEQMELIGDAARVWRPVGNIDKVVVVNQKAKRMRMVLPQILGLAPPADVYEPDKAQRDLEMWRSVRKVCDSMIGYYEQAAVDAEPVGWSS